MSSFFSDPPFQRGSTLLQGELIELDPSGLPLAGNEIVGQVKIFQDLNPGTGPAAVRYSNRMVYCVAARWTPLNGTDTLNANGAGEDRGRAYVLDRRAPLATFSAVASGNEVADGRIVGVLDEYLFSTVRPNDIVWLVVKGPTTIRKAANTVILGSAGVEVSSGLAITKATQANLMANAIDPVGLATTTAASGTGALQTITCTIPNTQAALVVAGAPVTGTNVPTGAYVNAAPTISSVGTTTTTLSFVLNGTIATAIGSGTTLTIGGASVTGTFARVQVLTFDI